MTVFLSMLFGKKINRCFLSGKRLFFVFFFFLAMGIPAGCNIDGRKRPGDTFCIGYEEYAPYLYTDDGGRPAGYDLELAREVARRNKWVLLPKKINWEDKDRLLASGEVDALWNGLKLTRERAEKYACSRPYLTSAEVIVVRKNSRIDSADDLTGKVLGVQSSTPTCREFTIGSLSPLAKSLKHLLTFGDSAVLRAQLNSGAIDALVTDVRVIQEYQKKYPDSRILSPSLFETLNVIGFKKGNTGLREQVGQTIAKMRDDGCIRELNRKWFGSGITTENAAGMDNDLDTSLRKFSVDGLYLDEALRLVTGPQDLFSLYSNYVIAVFLILLSFFIVTWWKGVLRKRKQKQLSSILSNMKERIIVFSEDRRVLYSHFPESEKPFLSKNTISGIEGLPEKDRVTLESKLDQLYSNGIPFVYEYQIFGRWRTSRWALLPADNPFGKKSVICTSSDTTEQSRNFHREMTVNACMEAFLKRETANVPFDRIFKIVCHHLNASYCYVLHADLKKRCLICRTEYSLTKEFSCFQNLPPPSFNPDDEWYRMLLQEKSFLWVSPYMNTTADFFPCVENKQIKKLHTFPHIISGIFLHEKIWGTLGIFFDSPEKASLSISDRQFVQTITHMIELMLIREASHDKLIQTAQEAENANRAKDYFLATMSHEIRTPLNAVIGFTEVLQSEQLPEAVRNDYLNSISRAGKALLDIINDILDLSKLEAGRMVFMPEPTDFEALIHEVGLIFRQRRLEKGLEAVYDVRVEQNIFIDKSRVRQILFNLIGNALKFTARGSLTMWGRFHPDTNDSGTLIFRVSDTGIGISEKDRKTLFEPFVQAKAVRGSYAANQGTGLGLVIVRRMVDRMGGTIELKSALGRGTSFTVAIPRIRFSTHTDVRVPAPKCTVVPFRLGKKVLLVDDVPMNLKVLTALMHKLGIDADSVESGKEALLYIEKNQPDIVLTDLWMPEMNGAELATAIRKSHPRIRIIALTADVDGQKTFDMSSFNRIITKPVTLEKLCTIADLFNGNAKSLQDHAQGPEEKNRLG